MGKKQKRIVRIVRLCAYAVFSLIATLAHVGVSTWQYWVLLAMMVVVEITTALENTGW